MTRMPLRGCETRITHGTWAHECMCTMYVLQLTGLLDTIRAAEADPRLGHLPKEQPTGALAELWLTTLQSSGLTLVDAAPGEEGM